MICAVIWDLDGTLIDSYRCIVPSLRQFYEEQGLALDEKDILSEVLRGSVRAFAEAVRQQTGISLDAGMERYREIRMEQEQALAPMPGARAVLDALAAAGVPSFLYTHRGETTAAVLERTGLAGAFCEIVTAESGFPRKPAPDALLYLIRRHGLSPAETCYVGDRQLDMDCAGAAGIRGILFALPGSEHPVSGPYARISDLRELLARIEKDK